MTVEKCTYSLKLDVALDKLELVEVESLASMVGSSLPAMEILL